jgi:hypothetical protein
MKDALYGMAWLALIAAGFLFWSILCVVQIPLILGAALIEAFNPTEPKQS